MAKPPTAPKNPLPGTLGWFDRTKRFIRRNFWGTVVTLIVVVGIQVAVVSLIDLQRKLRFQESQELELLVTQGQVVTGTLLLLAPGVRSAGHGNVRGVPTGGHAYKYLAATVAYQDPSSEWHQLNEEWDINLEGILRQGTPVKIYLLPGNELHPAYSQHHPRILRVKQRLDKAGIATR